MSEPSLNLQPNALRDLRDRQRRVGHDDHEFLAAVSCAHVEGANAGSQIRDLPERAITFKMSARIVHELEVVDVDQYSARS